MKIKWLGHSCFLLTGDGGIRILTDPFDASVGYPLPAVEADIVTTSHGHFDHGYVQTVKGSFVHLSKPGRFNPAGIEIQGTATFHDQEKGAKRGSNVVYTFAMDGMRICHLGDLGHLLSDEQVVKIGEVDILLVPVGGTYTIDHREAARVAALLSPKVVIPMHFKTPEIDFPINGVEEFLAVMGSGQSTGSQEIALNRDSLSTVSKVLVLDYGI